MQRRLVGAALLAVTIAAQFGARPTLATHAPPVLVGVTFKAFVDGPRTVCANKPMPYRATISMYYEFDDGHTKYVSNMGGQQGIMEIEAAGKTTRVQSYPNFLTSFQLTFPNPGTYDVTAFGIRQTAGALDPIAPDKITVVVEPCDYRISQLSIWYHLAEGFKPFVGGVVDAVRFQLEPGQGPRQGIKPLRTFAIGTFSCPITFDVEDVNATILAELTKPDNLHYYIAYNDGTAKVTIQCPTPVQPVGGFSEPRPFKLDLIEGDVPVGPICVLTCIWTYTGPVVSRQFPHVLHQESDANGVTYVIVEPVQ
jgi:hypothetical protein